MLTQAGYTDLPPAGTGSTAATGIEAAADEAHDQSPETYVGYRRGQNFVSPGGFVQDHTQSYASPSSLGLNQWALAGTWMVDPEKAVLSAAPGKIVYRFYARDLHLVLGPGVGGKPVRFRVQLDGAAPGPNHGVRHGCERRRRHQRTAALSVDSTVR